MILKAHMVIVELWKANLRIRKFVKSNITIKRDDTERTIIISRRLF